MNKISQRQIYFFLACIAPVGKLVIMPARLAEYSGNDLWLPALAQFALQALAVFCVLLLAKRNMSLYELLSNTFGKIVGKILVLLVGAFLLYAGVLPLLEQKLFVQGVFYDTLPSLLSFAPFFLFAAYLCSKPLSSYGRVFDLLAPVAIAGLAGVIVFSAGNADYGAILPVGASGVKGIASGGAYSFAWFFDSALLLMMLGKFDYRKGMAWKGALCYLAGGAATVFFLITFYGVFEGTAINQLFAFTKTSKYFSGFTVLGRVDYLFIFALSLVAAFYTALPVSGAIESVVQAFGRKKYLPTLLAVGFSAIYFLIAYFFDYRFGEAMKAISQQGFWLFPVFTLVVPPLLLLLRKRRKHESA